MAVKGGAGVLDAMYFQPVARWALVYLMRASICAPHNALCVLVQT